MKERIHQHLDGELPREELTPSELTELEAYRAVLEETGALAATPTPDVTEAVMAEVAGRRHSVVGRVWAWLMEPRPIAVRPLYPAAALGLAAALVGGALWSGLPGPTDLGPAPVAAPEETVGGAMAGGAAADTDVVLVQFRLDEPDATSVGLTGTFTGWEGMYQLHETSPGVWSAVLPVRPGVHEYVFVVDGEEWRPDPTAPSVDDGFGGENSRLAVKIPVDNAS